MTQKRVDLPLCTHVNAAGGLIHDDDLWGQRKPLPDQALLLIAAGQAADGVFNARNFDGQLLYKSVGQASLQLVVQPNAMGDSLHVGAGHIVFDTHLQKQALGFAVLGQVTDACIHSVTVGVEGTGPAVEHYLAGTDGINGAQTAHNLAPSRAHQPGKTQDLPPPQGKTDFAEDTAGEAVDLQNRIVRCDTAALGWVEISQLTAHHSADDIVCTDISGVHGSDIGTILEHSDPVADFKDFRHAVGDVENADSPTAQFLYQIKEPGSLLFREGGGWLIQNQQLAVE